MEQRHVLLSALSVGLGVGVGLKLASGQKPADSGDSLTSDRIAHELNKQLIVGRDDKVTLDEFPYFLSERTRSLLISSSYVHLKYSEFSKHTKNLAAASRTIMLTGAAELYHQMLARALAHHFDSKLLLLDTNDFSIKMQSKYGYVRKPPTMKRSISEATLAQVSTLLGSFSILPSKDEGPSAEGTGEHQKHRRTTSAVSESTQRTCPPPRKQSIGWCFNEKIFLQSLYKVLTETSEKSSVILYLRDPEKFVLQSPKTYSLFSKFLAKLSGPVLVLASMNPNKDDDVAVETVAELFPYSIEIKPPEDESNLTKWKTQLEEDMRVLQVYDNRNHIQQILAANDIECDDLSSVSLSENISTGKLIDEAVVSAISYHLANTKNPEYRNGKLIITAKSLSHGFSLMGEGNNMVTNAETKEEEGVSTKTETESKTEPKKEGENPSPAKPVEPDNEFEKKIRQEVIPAKEIGVTFGDIGSMEEIKESLQELVMLPLRRPDLFTGGLLKPCRGILLFGPPGTGKTMLGKAIAKEAGASFINVSMSTITSKWFGEDEKNVRALFTLAAKVSPTIIFVDEVDSMLGQRTRVGEHEAMRKIKNEFMTHWDGLMTNPGERILVLAATNRPFDLDEAIIRRFERRIMVGLPSSESREKILRTLLAKEKTENLDFKEIATMTEGYSGSDLKNLCVTAAYRPLRELIEQERSARKRESEEPNGEQPLEAALRALSMEDMRQAKNQVAASFAAEGSIMQELKQWNDMYGEGGSRKKQQLSYFL